MRIGNPLVGLLCVFAISAGVQADEIVLEASKDNTLYGESGLLSNGIGDYFFAGTTGSGNARRAVLAFDLSDIPVGATIDSVSLQLNMSRTMAGAQPVALHRLNADWGEAKSHAFGEEGGGTLALAGDATWSFRFFDTDGWSAMGGDFAAAASATTMVGSEGFYTWSSGGMVADVQSWIDEAGGNFGWILIGNEDAAPTAKRFDSLQNLVAERRPKLTVEFNAGSDCQGDLDDSGDVGFNDLLAVLAAWGPCDGCVEDIDMSGDVGFTDLLVILAAWGPCP
ncbi:MAG: DNRLRE domain-containing protein [Phycisphaerales bacterium]|nr:DNRLRE domain-containing protein [Phycisphaerales bacterium]